MANNSLVLFFSSFILSRRCQYTCFFTQPYRNNDTKSNQESAKAMNLNHSFRCIVWAAFYIFILIVKGSSAVDHHPAENYVLSLDSEIGSKNSAEITNPTASNVSCKK